MEDLPPRVRKHDPLKVAVRRASKSQGLNFEGGAVLCLGLDRLNQCRTGRYLLLCIEAFVDVYRVYTNLLSGSGQDMAWLHANRGYSSIGG